MSAPELFRISVTKGNHSLSFSDSVIYEGREAFEDALFRGLLDEVSFHGSRSRFDTSWRWIHAWHKQKHGESGNVVVKKVRRVEKLVRGQWEPVTAELIPPRLEWSLDNAIEAAQ